MNTLTLPRERCARTETRLLPVGTETEKARASNRVLIVDDEPRVREFVCRVLESTGLSCTEASDADSALQYLQGSQVDLVVLDLMMPGRPGAELLRQLHEETPEIPVVLLTGRADFGAAILAMDYGAIAYLIKPVDVDELVLSVERALQRGHTAEGPVRLSKLVVSSEKKHAREKPLDAEARQI